MYLGLLNSTVEIVCFILHGFYHNLKNNNNNKVFEIESALSSGWEGGTHVIDYQMFNIKHRHSY